MYKFDFPSKTEIGISLMQKLYRLPLIWSFLIQFRLLSGTEFDLLPTKDGFESMEIIFLVIHFFYTNCLRNYNIFFYISLLLWVWFLKMYRVQIIFILNVGLSKRKLHLRVYEMFSWVRNRQQIESVVWTVNSKWWTEHTHSHYRIRVTAWYEAAWTEKIKINHNASTLIPIWAEIDF